MQPCNFRKCDLSVARSNTFRKRVHFWYLKSAHFLETRWGPLLSSAILNRDKIIHCQRKRRNKHPAKNVAAESAPHLHHAAKACDQHPNNSKPNGALAKMGIQASRDLPSSLRSCHSVRLAKALSRASFGKKGHCSNLIFKAVNR